MRKILILLFVFIFTATLSYSASDNKKIQRVEETKRTELRKSEKDLSSQDPSPRKAEIIDGYLQELLSQDTVTIRDAIKTLILLLRIDDRYPDFSSQVFFFESKHIFPKEIGTNYDAPLTKGIAAFMYCRALEIKGGIFLRVFGPAQRYALREMVYQGIMVEGTVNDLMSGRELVYSLGQGVKYIQAYKVGKDND